MAKLFQFQVKPSNGTVKATRHSSTSVNDMARYMKAYIGYDLGQGRKFSPSQLYLKNAAYFDQEGMGGAFYLGYIKDEELGIRRNLYLQVINQ